MEQLDKKWRILLVHNYYQVPGGEDTVVANEKKLLEQHGHTVYLYSRNNNELHSMSIWGKLCVPFSTIFSLRTYREVKRFILEKNVDILHVHNTLSLISPSVYYAAIACRIPVIQTVHNFRLLCPAATFYRDGKICEDCLSKGLSCAVRHACYRKSRIQTMGCVATLIIHRLIGTYKRLHYICLTEFNRQKLLQINKGEKQIINPNRIYIKPNFTFQNDCEEIREDNSEYYLYVGRIEKLKGVPMLVSAFERMGNKSLKLAGSGELYHKYQQKKEEYKREGIEFLGQQSQEEVKRLMRNAKALIFPTQWYEGFPVIIAESFSQGTPVICSDLGNAGDLISEGITGAKFCYNDELSLMEAIDRFEKSNCHELGQNARKQFEQMYDSSINYKLLIEIYQTMLESDCDRKPTRHRT